MHFNFMFLLLIGNAMRRKEIKGKKEERKEKLGNWCVACVL
jgi:hypothetical protein